MIQFWIFHGGMPDASWNYATLPFHSGGMGLTPAALLPDICYVASILSTVFTAFSVSHTNYEPKISEWKQHLVCRTLFRNMAHY